MRKQFLGIMVLCGALLVGCSQGNSLQDQVESLTGETQAFITEEERLEEFGFAVEVLDDLVKVFNYDENIIVRSSYCAKRTSFTKEEDIKFGYDVSTPVMTYDYAKEILDNHNLQDVKLIMEVKTYQEEVIGYYDGTVWEEAK